MAYEKENIAAFSRGEVRTMKFIVMHSHPIVSKGRTPNTQVTRAAVLAKRQMVLGPILANARAYATRQEEM